VRQPQDQLVLAVETTAPRCGAALAGTSGADVRVLAEHYAPAGAGRAEALAGCVRAVLETAGCRAAELTGIGVVDGPGSYTALRVGLALARGIALIDGLRLAPVGSLELVALGVASARAVCAVLDAGQGKVYAAGYVRDGACVREAHAPFIVSASALRDQIRTWDGTWTVCADAAIAAAVGADVAAPAERAGVLARAAIAQLGDGKGVEAELVLPRYVGATGARANPVTAPAAALSR
jgi:tRNA threonylcarbamoyl adenosine modification protein YeaZ